MVKPSEKGLNRKEYCITENDILHLKKWLSEAHVDESMRNDFRACETLWKRRG